jgi:hypothetical protein
MIKLVELPDGTRIGFPDHLSDEEIEARLCANLAPRAQQATEGEVRPDERVDFFPVRVPRVIRRRPR